MFSGPLYIWMLTHSHCHNAIHLVAHFNYYSASDGTDLEEQGAPGELRLVSALSVLKASRFQNFDGQDTE